ncbi:MAG: chloride channel protein [Desulfobacteraceae bacterium 4572_35.1]|nr:MAG: chloride channel protein [Desulfobacteraceae bacterium 4572_35.1]
MKPTTATPVLDWLQRHSTALLNKFHISETTFMALLAIAIGVLSGLCNYAFRKSIDFFHWLVIEQGMEFFNISWDHWNSARWWVILFPIVGSLLMIPFWLWFSKDLKFGFSAFLEQVNLRGAKIPGRTILTRGLASAITLGTGGSAGQEGPIAQMGGAVGSQFGQRFKVSGNRLKVLVACGVSGGIAATFNAPIAGVFFAQEIVLLSAFEISSFTSIVIASGISTVVSRALLGNETAFHLPPYQAGSHWELLLYVVLGGVVGVLAATFIDVHFRIKDVFDNLKIPRYVKPICGALLVGFIGVGLPQVFGNGYDFINDFLNGGGTLYLLLALIFFKAIATSITLGSGLPGGLFAPVLYIGAVIGGAFGHIAQMLFPSMAIAPGSYALIGMGAFLSAATHAPMTAIFLLFEMTSSYQVIVPIMLSCVVGTAISRHYKKESLDTVELAKAGIDLEAGKERNIMKALYVRDVMATKLETVPENMTLRQFTDFLSHTKHSNFPIVDLDGALTGIISIQDFMGVVFEKDLLDLVVVKELATKEVTTIFADENLDSAMQKIGYRNIEQLPVVAKDNNEKLIGIISRRDMVSAYNKELMARALEDGDE